MDPLVPLDMAGVVDLAQFRIRAGLPPSSATDCPHQHLVYNEKDRRVWCEQCERTLDAFDAFLAIVRNLQPMLADLREQQRIAREGVVATLNRRAAKELDRAWSGSMLPICPHCRAALAPEDFSAGCDLVAARRKIPLDLPGDGAKVSSSARSPREVERRTTQGVTAGRDRQKIGEPAGAATPRLALANPPEGT